MPAGGGLLQLVATGKQDLFLTGNPQISFFKMVYRRHTNFATEAQPMYFGGTPNHWPHNAPWPPEIPDPSAP